ncbi:RagB/SusD family nutrient uptake outer membrane protein [Ekhidna sp.]|uniref:RagB/SusD family nutrient uptake outer membrane protein n=1 Tax=Ekhidna sp. TaxID=2608089 RepID=UPI0032969B58
MKSIYNKIAVLLVLITLSACSLDEVNNPNAPTVSSFEEGASQQDLRLLTTGLEAVMRNDLSFHFQTVSILGREYNDLTQVDPRYTGEILVGPLDNNGFLTTRAYAAWYKIVQSANLLITAVDNSSTALSTEALDGYRGFARTYKAYALLMVANRQFSNGVRIDVSDPDNLGAFVTYDNALTAIRTMLNDANTELLNAASEFAAGEDVFDFAVSNGYGTPATFAQFNRAIAARVAIYQDDKAGALTILADSFMDETASLDEGPVHVFGLTGNDIANPLFYVPNQQRYMAHPSFEADAEAFDTRVTSKTSLFDPEDDPDLGPITVTFDGLSGDRQVTMYASNTSPVSIIRNEELLLIYAEANIGSDNAEALRVLDIIRAAAGLGASTANPAVDSEVEDEMLTQRRYSLFGEGHRWVDLRRYGRLSDLPLDRTGDARLSEFPTPFAENQ